MNKVIRKSIAPTNSAGVLQVKVMSVKGVPESKSLAVKLAIQGISKSVEKRTKTLQGNGSVNFSESVGIEISTSETLNREEPISLVATILDSEKELSNIKINLNEVIINNSK
jgi:hypothetical protein